MAPDGQSFGMLCPGQAGHAGVALIDLHQTGCAESM